MGKLTAIWRKEFNTFWYSPIAYIVIIAFLVVVGWLYFEASHFFLVDNADMRPLFGWMPIVFLLILPALTMREWAEEHNTGTVETLMTQPVSEWQAVLGKYLAVMTILVIMLVLTLPIAITVNNLAQDGLDWGVVLGSYLGALFLGAAYLAIGGWISSITQNQIVAFIVSVAVVFVLIVIGENFVTMFAPTTLALPMKYLGLRQHFQSVARGVIDTRDLVYYASVIFLFLYLTVRAVENRKWS